jgi:hypothetical protein
MYTEIGAVIGTLFMAFHSAQGPKLGLPQMIQSRPQFGYVGALLVWAFAYLQYAGFNIFNTILAGDSLNGFSDSLRRQKSIAWMHMRHEEAAAFASTNDRRSDRQCTAEGSVGWQLPRVAARFGSRERRRTAVERHSVRRHRSWQRQASADRRRIGRLVKFDTPRSPRLKEEALGGEIMRIKLTIAAAAAA